MAESFTPKAFVIICPFIPNEQYAKMIREQTIWYDLTLNVARNAVVAHGRVGQHTIGTSPQIKYPRPMITELSSSNEHHEMVLLKKKYESDYPELTKVNDSLWEIIDYFVHNEIKMSQPDIEKFTRIVKKAGMELPDPSYLALHIKKFLEDLGKIFNL